MLFLFILSLVYKYQNKNLNLFLRTSAFSMAGRSFNSTVKDCLLATPLPALALMPKKDQLKAGILIVTGE
jgi:hypothetical protein